MSRRLLTALLLPCAALLGGCVAIKGFPSASQDGVVGGPVRIQVTICASDNGSPPAHANCQEQTNRPFKAPDDDYQVLLGFRLPAGVSAPQSFSSTAGEALAFARSASYERELDRLVPPGQGKVWVGYISGPYALAYAASEPAREATVAPAFQLPRPAGGGPFIGSFTYRAVVGGREIGDSGEPTAGDPVDCGTVINNDPTACIDSPLQDQLGGDSNMGQPRDFGVVAGSATASPGQTVEMPFRVRGAGALPAGLTTALTAATSLPGAAVAPSQTSAPLSNGSDTRVTVPVAIPKSAGPGTFEVTLTGRLENGQARTGTARLTVRDRQAPVLVGARVKPKRFRAATRRRPRRGTNVSFRLSEVGQVRIVVERCAKRARGERTGRCLRFKAMKGALTRSAVAGSNRLRFNGRVRDRALKAGPYRLALTPTDTAGNRGATVRARLVVARP